MVLDNWRKQAHLFCTNNKSLGSRAPPMNIPFNGLFKLAFGLSQSLDQWVMFINTRSIPKNAHIPLNRRSSKPSFYIQPTAFFFLQALTEVVLVLHFSSLCKMHSQLRCKMNVSFPTGLREPQSCWERRELPWSNFISLHKTSKLCGSCNATHATTTAFIYAQ